MKNFLGRISDAFRDKNEPGREESPSSSEGLTAGSRHYRAWVGPPDQYAFMGAMQVELLLAAGIRETDKVCDVGCGSLRAGRMLIPYLNPGGYHGIEPDRDMLRAGIENEIGDEILRLKKVRFLHGTDFPLPEFGVAFDVVLAQSIWSHTYPGLMREGFAKVAASLARRAVCSTHSRRAAAGTGAAPDGSIRGSCRTAGNTSSRCSTRRGWPEAS